MNKAGGARAGNTDKKGFTDATNSGLTVYVRPLSTESKKAGTESAALFLSILINNRFLFKGIRCLSMITPTEYKRKLGIFCVLLMI